MSVGWLVAVTAANAQPLIFSTWAGYAGHGASDGVSTNAQFNNPQGVAMDASGNLYVADSGNNTIREITQAGVVSTIAGQAGVSGSVDGTNALFNQPTGIAVDSSGTIIYVADTGNNTIRSIRSTGGIVSTLAGSAGIAGSANATGTNALFNEPQGVAVDGAGNVYVTDYGNDIIRMITPAGVVSTLAGFAGNPGSADGTGAAAMFDEPAAIAIDSATNLYVADAANSTVRKITPAGVVTTLAGSAGSFGLFNATGTNAIFYQPSGIAVDTASDVYVADTFNNAIRKIALNGVVTTLSAQFSQPTGLAFGNGTLFIADTGNGMIRAITNGTVQNIAGSPSMGSANGPGLSARFAVPQSVAVDGNGNAYVADSANSIIRKITPDGTVTNLAGSPGVLGSTDGANALFANPAGVAVDANGAVYVADTGNSTIRKITSGTVSTLAGIAGTPGNLDGIGTAAQFNHPMGMAVDQSGNVYVADSGNNTIRKITSGTVSTLAGSIWNFGSSDGTGTNALFHQPEGITIDSSGNVYVADTLNNTVREITPGGVVTTIAGMPGVLGSMDGSTNALFCGPIGATVDGSGNVFVTDTGNDTIRKIVSGAGSWTVATVAGQPAISGSSDGTGSGALFANPAGIAWTAGYFYIADSGNNTIRLDQTVPPAITSQPLGQTNLTGTPITLSVSATGTAPLNYTWELNGGAVGPNTNMLTVLQGGNYLVLVMNAAGTATSLVATVTYTNPIPTAFQNILILSNGAVELNMTASVGSSNTLQASTDLMNWTNLTILNSTNGSLQYLDFDATNFPARFYRLTP
jgi:DNA-binding beta-propeller fold protein YncE